MRIVKTGDFFFCYTKAMSDFLSDKNISYFMKAKSIKDNNIFTMYQKSDELYNAINDYKKQIR